MEVIEIYRVLRRRIWMILLLCVSATVAGFCLTYLVPEQYKSSTLILVRPQEKIQILSSSQDKEVLNFPVGPTMSAETPGKTYIEIITSQTLIEKVVRLLNLDQEDSESNDGGDAEDGPVISLLNDYKEILKNHAKYAVQLLKYGRTIDDDPFTKTVEEVQGNLTLETSDDTYVFSITYSATEPGLAADIANTVAELFNEYLSELRSSESLSVAADLQKKLQKNKKQLALARQRLKDFKTQHSIFEYETEYAEKLRLITELEISLVRTEATLVAQEGTLSARKLEAERTQLFQAIEVRRAGLANFPDLERQLAFLELDINVARTGYETVAKELEETRIKGSFEGPDVSIVSRATPANFPYKPIRAFYAAVSLFAALMVGICLAFLLEYIKPMVRSVDDVEESLGMTVLATIPFHRQLRW